MWREAKPYTSLCKSTSTPRYTLPMLSTHLGKFCFLSPALNSGRTGEKSTKATERALPLCLFHLFSEKQWQDLMEYIIPFRFCMLCLKALIKKKKTNYAYSRWHTQKYMWIQGYWIKEGCSNIPPPHPVHYLYSRFLKWHCNLMMHQPIILSSRTNILAFSL